MAPTRTPAFAPPRSPYARPTPSSEQQQPPLPPSSATSDKIRRNFKYEPGTDLEEGEQLWTDELDEVLKQSLRVIPNIGRRKVEIDGLMLGRNGLMTEYLFRKTGKVRSKTQIASHIQILKKHNSSDPTLFALLTQPPIEGIDPLPLNWPSILGPPHPSTLSSSSEAELEPDDAPAPVSFLAPPPKGTSSSPPRPLPSHLLTTTTNTTTQQSGPSTPSSVYTNSPNRPRRSLAATVRTPIIPSTTPVRRPRGYATAAAAANGNGPEREQDFTPRKALGRPRKSESSSTKMMTTTTTTRKVVVEGGGETPKKRGRPKRVVVVEQEEEEEEEEEEDGQVVGQSEVRKEEEPDEAMEIDQEEEKEEVEVVVDDEEVQQQSSATSNGGGGGGGWFSGIWKVLGY